MSANSAVGGRAGVATRLIRLYLGLALFGLSIALMVHANLGLGPWDVLHQGLARTLDLPIGWVVIGVSALVLLAWIPMRERPGLGTISNALLVGLCADVGLDELPEPHQLAWRTGYLVAGVVLTAAATGLYIGARFGPGPRDGLMTGLARRGHSIRSVRTAIEVTVGIVGLLLGGKVGIGTLLYAVSIGPLVQLFLQAEVIAPRRAGPPPARNRPKPSGANEPSGKFIDASGKDGIFTDMSTNRPSLRVMVIIASTRPGRLAPTVARWFTDAVGLEVGRRGCSLDVADLAEIALPFLDEPDHPSTGSYAHEHTRAWSRRVAAADAFVVVTPEYNYGMPAVLKNALDFLYHEWSWKPVAFISYGNTSAGTRSVQMTKQVVTTLRMVPIGATIALRIGDTLSGRHVSSDPGLEQEATRLLDELLRVAAALRQVRVPDSGLVAANTRGSAEHRR